MDAIPDTMKAAVYYRNSDVRIEDLPVPKIGPGELLVKVTASGLCGSDVMEWYRIHKAPLVLGHEIAGTIAKVGEGLENHYRVGQRVSASHHVPCLECRHCQRGHETNCDTLHSTTFDPGGFVEYLRLRPINVEKGVYPVPDEVSDEQATFTEPLACVLRGQERAHVGAGDSVVIIGCGIAGLLHVALAKARGAERIIAIDIIEPRLEAALEMGADTTIQPNKAKGSDEISIKLVNEGRLADKVILCTGARPALESALNMIEPGGTLLFFAPTDPGEEFQVSFNDLLWAKDVTITSSYAGSPEDHCQALELISSGHVPVEKLITHRLQLFQAQEGFDLVAQAQDSLKVILLP